MHRNILILIAFLYPFSYLTGQTWSHSGLSSLNPYRSIASYGGLDRSTMFTSHLRTQWSNLTSNPRSQYIGVHTPVYVWKGAVGLDILNQSQGVINLRRLRASYNNVMKAGSGLLSIGGRVGIAQASVNGREIITPEGQYADGFFDHNDPILSIAIANGLTPTFDISASYITPSFYAGINLSDITFHNLKVNDASVAINPQIDLFLRYFLLTDFGIDFQLSSATRTDFINYQSEVSLISKINGNIFGGILARGYSSSSLDAFGILFGHAVNDRFSMHYIYEFGLSNLRSVHDGTHELLVKYSINKLFGTGLPPRTIYNPRFL